MKSSERHRFFQEASALVLCSISILLLLALVSFDPCDVSFFTATPNKTATNFIGPVGAYIAAVLYICLGVGAYLIPLTAFGIAAVLATKPFRHPWLKPIVTLFLIVSGAGLLQLSQPVLGYILPNPIQNPQTNSKLLGGLVGYFLNDQILAPYLGSLGSGLILGSLYLLCFIFLFEVNPIQACKDAYSDYLDWKERKELEKLESADPVEVLAMKRKILEKEQKRLQKQLAKRGSSLTEIEELEELEEKRARPEPQIIDTTIKKSTSTQLPSESIYEPGNPKEDAPLKPKKVEEEPKVVTRKKIAQAIPAETPSEYRLPNIDLLNINQGDPIITTSEEELRALQKQLIDTLQEFDVEVSPGDITRGATITRYEVFPAPGIRVERILSLKNNIARSMKAERINILAPIPGKDTVGIEIANSRKATVTLRDLFESSDWNSSRLRLPVAIGKDIYGKVIIDDLAEMPHMLIGGTTGSGKSVCINCILLSLLYRFKPDDLRLILVDPKVVELATYNELPHLVFPVVTDPKKVLFALRYVINEMEKRYKIMAKAGVRNIAAYNARKKEAPQAEQLSLDVEPPPAETDSSKEDELEMPEHLPYYVIIIDELADLMQTTAQEVEDAIARLSAKARAAGIHVIIATQTPRASVITGVIKTNVPARIAFQVPSALDSRVILDENGAENLLGKGDLLYLRPGSSKLTRAQGGFVSEEEVSHVVEFIKKQMPNTYDTTANQKMTSNVPEAEDISEEDEALIQKCFEIIRQEKRASTSLLQRRLRIGYGTAAWVIDQLENRGVVGPKDGAKDREILIDLDKGLPPAPTYE